MRNILSFFWATVMVVFAATASFAQSGTSTADSTSGSNSDAIAQSIDDSYYEGSVGLPSTTANPCVVGGSAGVPGVGGVGVNIPTRACRIFEETQLMRQLYGDDYAREHMQKIPRVRQTVNTVNERKNRARAGTVVSTRSAAASVNRTPAKTTKPITLRLDGKRYNLNAEQTAFYMGCGIITLGKTKVRHPNCSS